MFKIVNNRHFFGAVLFFTFFMLSALLASCASQGNARAEEYFSIGMAYYELGNYAEAEKWLDRARTADRTLTASEYNLGRIAFETGRYGEAALYFEGILGKDPENVMALKAAAYSRIRNGDLERAEALYDRALVLVPESVDDGYNYALVLYGLEKYGRCEEVLMKYPRALEDNPPSQLLMARAQKAQGKVEAVDTYARWIEMVDRAGALELYEYAQALEAAGLYARALEQYDEAANAISRDTAGISKSSLSFEKARLLLIADPENDEGIGALNTAVSEGFSDTAAIGALLSDGRVSAQRLEEIQRILDGIAAQDTSRESAPP